MHVIAHLTPHALRQRLDDELGVAGWSVRFEGLVGGAVACHLIVEGVTKGAVAAPGVVGGAAATADVAFAAAADLLGLRPPVPHGASFWLPCDPETLEPLHPPDLDGLAEVGPGGAGPAVAMAPTTTAAPNAAQEPTGDRPAADDAPPAPVEPAQAPGVLAPSDGNAAKPTGQQMIDRLVERLKGEGQGLAAARLLVKYGGYGKDPEAARELYAHLRELLLTAPAGEGTAGRG